MPSSDYVGGHTFTYSPEERDEPAITIVEAVAWLRNLRSQDLEPLQRIIDVDTLNGIFGGRQREFYGGSTDSGTSGLALSFQYGGCEVTVEQSRIRVDPERHGR